MTAGTAYREPGLSRDALRIWHDEPLTAGQMAKLAALVTPMPPRRPSAPRCPSCRYRTDAPGHATACGTRLAATAHP